MAGITKGTKLHALYADDGMYYPAVVVDVSSAKKRANKPVKVSYSGYGEEAWVPIEALKSKKKGVRVDQINVKAKAIATHQTYEVLEARLAKLEDENSRLRAAIRMQTSPCAPFDLFPDLVQVHSAISGRADSVKKFADFQHLLTSRSEGGRQWMFNLMPIWNWHTHNGAPRAEEFWKLAHAVSRDDQSNDWIAPHVTLHSRSKDLNGLAAKFMKLVTEFGTVNWRALLFGLREEKNWDFDQDLLKRAPSRLDHYMLHKAKIQFPQDFRAWLDTNQDAVALCPRKQDRDGKQKDEDGKFRIEAPFHISLYSFRAARRADSLDLSAKDCSALDSLLSDEPRVAHHGVPKEGAVRSDLARADWTLVLLSPGWTGTPACSPQVLAAVRLSDLASGALK